MNDDELKALWRSQKTEAPPLQIDALRKKISQLDATLKARDFREFIASGVVIVIFAIYFVIIPHPVTRVGAIIIIAGALFASWKTIDARKRAPKPDPAAPVSEWVRAERDRVHHEAELLRTVLWWYILPLWVGVNVFFSGFPNTPVGAKVAYGVATTALSAGVYWMNQYARRKQLLPVQAELEELLSNDAPPPSPEPRPAKRRNFLIAGVILVIAFGGQFLFAKAQQPMPATPPPFSDLDDHAAIDRWLQEQVATCKLPALSVALVRDGKMVFHRNYGFADLKTSRGVTPETSFHVASVTKVFTALMASKLHDSGVLRLDDPLAKYLPQGVQIDPRITLRQLASHTSGLPRGVPGPVQSVEGRYELEPERLYKLLAEVKIESEPGKVERYSNLGFGLLGHALERATGKSYEEILQELICKPMGLERTSTRESGNLDVATGYTSTLPRRATTHSYRERFAGSGGLIASAPDLAKFVAVQMQPGESRLGWTIRRAHYEKNGGRNNCSAFIGYNWKFGVVVLSNAGAPDIDPIGRWLLERAR